MTLGERLIRLRQDKNIKQIDAAKDLRISNVVLNRYEKDERVPDKDMLKTIADYYVCSLDFLLGRTDYRTYPHIQAAHIDVDGPPVTEDALNQIEEIIKREREKIRREKEGK